MSSDKLAQIHKFEIEAFGSDYEEFFVRVLRVRRALENHSDLDEFFEYDLDSLSICVRELTEDCLFLQALELGMGLREVPAVDSTFCHHYPDTGDLNGWLKASGTTLHYAGPGHTRTIESQYAMKHSLSDPSSDLSPLERHLGMSLLGLWVLVDRVTENMGVGLRMDWILQAPKRLDEVRNNLLKISAIDEAAPERSRVTGFVAVRKTIDAMTANVENPEL